jgi:hypothetical protein
LTQDVFVAAGALGNRLLLPDAADLKEELRPGTTAQPAQLVVRETEGA